MSSSFTRLCKLVHLSGQHVFMTMPGTMIEEVPEWESATKAAISFRAEAGERWRKAEARL